MSTGPTTLPGSPNAEQRNRRRRLPRLRDARIRSKLALILVVPVAAVIALATIRLVSVGEGAYEADRVRSLSAVSVDIAALTQDLHKERIAAAVFLADPNQKPDAYNLRVRQTDERIAAYQDERGKLGDVSGAISNQLKVIDAHLSTLNGTRQEVLDRLQMPVAEASLRYGIVLDDLVAYSDALAQQPGADSLADARRAVAAFAHAKAQVAEEQAVAFTALDGGQVGEEQFSSFVATLTGQQEALLTFSRTATPGQRALVDRTVSGDAVQLADRVAGDAREALGVLRSWPGLSLAESEPRRESFVSDDEHVLIAKRGPQLVASGMEALAERFPVVGRYTPAQREATEFDLGQIVEFLCAGLLVDDPELFGTFLDWLCVVLGTRRVPLPTVDLVLDVYQQQLYDFPRARAHLAAGHRRLAG